MKAIKYIHNYIYKGSDRTTLQLQAVEGGDEIKKFLQGRYIGPCEAVWGLLEFRMHEEFPAVYQLPIHLPGEYLVYFSETATAIELQAHLDIAKSKLIAWFAYNAMYSDSHHLLYQHFPEKYVFIEKQKVWHKRKQGFAIGRMYHCNPLQGERFYLRLLLTVVAGVKSFSHLRTVNGIVYDRYQEACVAMGLLEDDQ